jgi:hypothetical protein
MSILTYKGTKIEQREIDGYVNLTQMAQANNVEVRDWYRLQGTKAYLEALESDVQICTSQLIIVKKGNSKKFSQGTWGHPLIALNFGRWINPRFAIWCDQHIQTLLETGKTEIITEPPKKAIQWYSERIQKLPECLEIDKDYWTVIEQCGYLLLEIERLGYPIDKFDLLDGSIGRRWSLERKRRGLTGKTKLLKYKMENRKQIEIQAYSYDELGIFSHWLKNVYMTQIMPKYLEGKYGKLATIS